MITGWDDYFIHQTARPILEPGDPRPNFMDRMHFNVQDSLGRFTLGVGFGQYRNTARMDALTYVILPGEQRVLRLARRTTPEDFATPEIGCQRFLVEKPLERWRWILDENDTGAHWDITYRARRRPVRFAPFRFGDGAESSDFLHFVQLGTATGTVRIDGASFDIDGTPALRDRSWGVRRSKEKQGLHLWLMHAVGDTDFHIIYNEARDGSVAYLDGAVVDGSGEHRILQVGHELDFVDGTPDVQGGRVTVVDDRGLAHELSYRRVLNGYVGGVGYGGWAGADHPDGLVQAERQDLNGPAADILAAQPLLLFDHLCTVAYAGSQAACSFQMGITRSRAYTYEPREVR